MVADLSKYNQPISGGRELEAQKPGFQNAGARLFGLRLFPYFHALELTVEPGKERGLDDEERIESCLV
jgi:hypothetical protein